jgi:hypothetical protein
LAFEVEHIVPTSRGGADDESNLALASRACNLYKSDQLSGVDEVTRELVPLFHPRRDHWEVHFRVESEDGSIQGLTTTGRVTVACLRMNRDVQREARRSWMQLAVPHWHLNGSKRPESRAVPDGRPFEGHGPSQYRFPMLHSISTYGRAIVITLWLSGS